MLKEEKINENYLLFIKYLEKYNCYSQEMDNEIGELIKRSPYSIYTMYGGAYDGGLIDITLNNLCKNGFKINENAFGRNSGDKIQNTFLYVNPSMLMRCLLLINLSKSIMFTKQHNTWKASNGQPYEFNPNLTTKLKTGERTLYLCQKYDIKLSEEEYEAISNFDNNENGGEIYQSPLSSIIKSAMLLTSVELRQKYLIENNKNNEIEEI